jgi:hypothetical protein
MRQAAGRARHNVAPGGPATHEWRHPPRPAFPRLSSRTGTAAVPRRVFSRPMLPTVRQRVARCGSSGRKLVMLGEALEVPQIEGGQRHAVSLVVPDTDLAPARVRACPAGRGSRGTRAPQVHSNVRNSPASMPMIARMLRKAPLAMSRPAWTGRPTSGPCGLAHHVVASADSHHRESCPLKRPDHLRPPELPGGNRASGHV